MQECSRSITLKLLLPFKCSPSVCASAFKGSASHGRGRSDLKKPIGKPSKLEFDRDLPRHDQADRSRLAEVTLRLGAWPVNDNNVFFVSNRAVTFRKPIAWWITFMTRWLHIGLYSRSALNNSDPTRNTFAMSSVAHVSTHAPVIDDKLLVLEDDRPASVADGISAAWIDPKKERRMMWKFDLFAVGLFGLFYMMANLDRSNWGNAQIAGMPEDIGLVGNQFGTATTLLYATYVPFEAPAALLVKKFSPKYLMVCPNEEICARSRTDMLTLSGLLRVVLGSHYLGHGFHPELERDVCLSTSHRFLRERAHPFDQRLPRDGVQEIRKGQAIGGHFCVQCLLECLWRCSGLWSDSDTWSEWLRRVAVSHLTSFIGNKANKSLAGCSLSKERRRSFSSHCSSSSSRSHRKTRGS